MGSTPQGAAGRTRLTEPLPGGSGPPGSGDMTTERVRLGPGYTVLEPEPEIWL